MLIELFGEPGHGESKGIDMSVWPGSPVMQDTYRVGVSAAFASLVLSSVSHELLDSGNTVLHRRGKFKKNQRKATKGKRK